MPLLAAASPARKTVAEHLEEDTSTALSAILLPSGFPLEEGTQLWQGVRLGKLLGAGAQVRAGGLDAGSSKGTSNWVLARRWRWWGKGRLCRCRCPRPAAARTQSS